jgi:hypothetical protein
MSLESSLVQRMIVLFICLKRNGVMDINVVSVGTINFTKAGQNGIYVVQNANMMNP